MKGFHYVSKISATCNSDEDARALTEPLVSCKSSVAVVLAGEDAIIRANCPFVIRENACGGNSEATDTFGVVLFRGCPELEELIANDIWRHAIAVIKNGNGDAVFDAIARILYDYCDLLGRSLPFAGVNRVLKKLSGHDS